MSLYNKIFKSLVFSLAAILVSCMQIEDSQDAAVGYLGAPSIAVDVAVADLMQTKALDFYVPVPSEDEITFVVKDKNGVIKYEGNIADWPSALAMVVGPYTVTAQAGTNCFGAPYFFGTSNGEITALTVTSPSIELALSNSLVNITVDSELENHFTANSIHLSSGSDSSDDAEFGTWYYVPSKTVISVTLDGKNSVGNDARFSYTMPSETVAKTAYKIVCEKDETSWPSLTIAAQQDGAWANRLYVTPGVTISGSGNLPESLLTYEVSTSSTDWNSAIQATKVGEYFVVDGLSNGSTYYVRGKIGAIVSEPVSITVMAKLSENTLTASHYNESGKLAGTNATLNYGFTGILKTLYDSGELQVSSALSKASTTLRTATSDAVTMTPSTGWPYLPQGSDYVLTTSHKLISESTAVTSTLSNLSVGAPTFTVSLGASYTSYDEYAGTNGITKNITNANSRNSETLYNVSASWSISASLLSNSNYSSGASTKIYLDGVEKASPSGVASHSIGNISGLTNWKSYDLKATVTFDGVTATASKTHHITGLPFVSNPPTSAHWSNMGDWACKLNWNSDHAEVSTDGSSENPGIVSNTFHIPSDISVRITSKVRVDGIRVGIWYNNTYYVKIGSSTIISQGSEKQKGKIFDTSGTGTMTSSANTISCYSDRKTAGYPVQIYNVYAYYN